MLFINLPPSFWRFFHSSVTMLASLLLHEGKSTQKPDEILIKKKSKQLLLVFFCCYRVSKIFECSIEFCEVKVIRRAAGFAVVEGVEAGVGVLELFGSVVEGSRGVDGSGDGDCHLRGEDCAVDALRALGCYSEYF